MSTQITDYAPAVAVEVRRQAIGTAQSVAQYVTGISPVLPTDINVYCPPFREAAELNLHFYSSVEDVDAFGRFFDLLVEEKPHSSGGRYVVAAGAVDGVPVTAWTLLPADAEGGAA